MKKYIPKNNCAGKIVALRGVFVAAQNNGSWVQQ
jgi:hypothetical protein